MEALRSLKLLSDNERAVDVPGMLLTHDFPVFTAVRDQKAAHLSRPTIYRSPTRGTQGSLDRHVYRWIRWSFYLFLFLIPLESLDPFGVVATFSLTKAAGLLFAVLGLSQLRVLLAPPPTAFWFFLVYVGVNILLGILLAPDYLDLGVTPTAVQHVLMFWFCCNLLADDRIAVRSLLALALGGAVLAGSMAAGIGTQEQMTLQGLVRVSALGQTLNTIGYLLAVTLVLILGLWFGRRNNLASWRHLLWFPLWLFAVQLARTGSRGGMASAFLGCLMLIVPTGGLRTHLKILALVGLLLVSGVYLVTATEVARVRWEYTRETGSTAGRTEIFAECWEMFTERPILGWGPTRSHYILGERLREYGLDRDPHNALLREMVGTGIAGTIPLIVGIGLCLHAAWLARNGLRGPVPLMLIATVLTMSMTISTMHHKITWVVLAYCAATTHFDKRKS